MRPILVLLLAVSVAAALPLPGAASLQPQMFCWSGDSEFPVACEYEGDDDEARARRRMQRPASSYSSDHCPAPTAQAMIMAFDAMCAAMGSDRRLLRYMSSA